MRSSKRYGRRIPETPQEVVDHPLWSADPERLGRWLTEEYGVRAAAHLWLDAMLLIGGPEFARALLAVALGEEPGKEAD